MEDVKKYNKKLYAFLEERRKEKQIKKIELCEKIGVASSTLSEQFSRLKAGDTITTDTLFKIMLALDIDFLEITKEENKNGEIYKNIAEKLKEIIDLIELIK